MPRESEPEIIPPGQQSRSGRIDDATLSAFASLLDDIFRLPGTSFRFGIDPIIGLIPGVGDLLTSVGSFLIVLAGWQRGIPRVTIARMLANIALDTILGSIPIVGDVFDAAWKSNRMNLTLLQGATQEPRRQRISDWLFLILIAAIVLAIVAMPFAIIWLLVRR